MAGELSHKFSKDIIHCLLVGLKDENEAIRVSSISDLSQFCSTLKHSLSYYFVEIISAIESVLKTDRSMNVKKACIMFMHIFLNGVDRDCLPVSNSLKIFEAKLMILLLFLGDN